MKASHLITDDGSHGITLDLEDGSPALAAIIPADILVGLSARMAVEYLAVELDKQLPPAVQATPSKRPAAK